MSQQFKVKTKLSFSPGKNKQSIFLVRGHAGKKQHVEGQTSSEDKKVENLRSTSHSVHKKKANPSKLFKDAHNVQPTETYLVGEKHKRTSVTNESSPPHSPDEVGSKMTIRRASSDKTNKGLSSKHGRKSMKDIQRTVAIAYKG